MTCALNPKILGDEMPIFFGEFLIPTIKIFLALSLDFPTKSLTTFSIGFLVDHWLEGVGGRQFADWLLLGRVC